jgi:uncharacterized protein with HEPN domain
MRREELYLTDIIEAADAIQKFLSGVERINFLKNDLLRSAVLQKLSIIGEAAARLPLEFRKQHPAIEWEDIIGFRNIAVHSYFAVDWSIVWVAATQEAPQLRSIVSEILAQEYSEAPETEKE